MGRACGTLGPIARSKPVQAGGVPFWVSGTLIDRRAVLFPFFYFKTRADKFVDLIPNEKMTFAELSIYVIAWISVPNEAYDLHKKLAVSPEPRITYLQESERSTAHLSPRLVQILEMT